VIAFKEKENRNNICLPRQVKYFHLQNVYLKNSILKELSGGSIID
jgi:hypothetical protein